MGIRNNKEDEKSGERAKEGKSQKKNIHIYLF